jgi:predicted amidohydrolase
MRVTVCELPNTHRGLDHAWERLIAHAHDASSDLVLLPEMPFAPWAALTRPADPAVWRSAVDAHEAWLPRLSELAPAAVAGTRPVIREDGRFNEGFVWSMESGYRAVHDKAYLPDEPGFWEAAWYERGERTFNTVQVGPARVGFLICTELWFNAHARDYLRQGVHLILSPRATPAPSRDRWIAGGRVAAIVGGAYSLSSNFAGDAGVFKWAGAGWVAGPEGDVLAVTAPEAPFATVEIDLAAAERARTTYPRYVPD